MKRAFLLLPFASAILVWASFHPLNLGFLAWAAYVPLVVFALAETKRWRVYLLAWLGGALSFGLSYVWVRHTFAAAPFTLGPVMGLYWMLLVALVRFGRGFPLALVVPVAVTTVDFMRAYFLGGLPYYLLGYSQNALLPLIQIADLGGVWLVGALVALVNGAIARAFFTPRERSAWSDAEYRRSIVVAAAAVALSLAYGFVRLATLPMEDGPLVAVIQPNIAQEIRKQLKMSPDSVEAENLFQQHVDLTRRAMAADPKPALVIWPESAIFKFPIYDPIKKAWRRDSHLLDLLDVPREAGVPVLLGALVYEPEIRDGAYVFECTECGATTAGPGFEGRGQACPKCRATMHPQLIPTNSALLLRPTGEIERYDKMQLVGFSERLPFSSWLPINRWVSQYLKVGRVYEFRPGASFPVWTVGGMTMGAEVCYEAAYPEISRKFARDGARTLVNISNEGWFSDSAELDLMWVMSRFRAIESRAHYVRATNTGISGFIEPTGREQSVLADPQGNRKQVEGTLAARPRLTTSGSLYRTVGDAVPWACVGAAVLGVVAGFRRRRFIDSGVGQT